MNLKESVIRSLIIAEMLGEPAISLLGAKMRCEAALMQTGLTEEQAREKIAESLDGIARLYDSEMKKRGAKANVVIEAGSNDLKIESWLGKEEGERDV